MEFEILNDILTGTVASLFPNKSVHLSYFRQEEDNQPKIDIPKSKSLKLN
jgi:hypothetical protein